MALPKVVNFEGIGPSYFKVIAKRKPRKGEFYLSGAIPEAFLACNDLLSDYWIAEQIGSVLPQ